MPTTEKSHTSENLSLSFPGNVTVTISVNPASELTHPIAMTLRHMCERGRMTPTPELDICNLPKAWLLRDQELQEDQELLSSRSSQKQIN